MHRLHRFAQQIGFTVRDEAHTISAVRVPCLIANGVGSVCTITKSAHPTTGRPTDKVGGAVHGVRIALAVKGDGRVYQSDGTALGALIGGDGSTWSHISIKKGHPAAPEDDHSASAVVYRYAKQIVGAYCEARRHPRSHPAQQSPLRIPNTFESRANIGPVQDTIRSQRIAIVGLGGTGAYVLDLLSKTPVSAIHLLDADDLEFHNFMRAPGAPSDRAIESLKQRSCSKVDYFRAKYSGLRDGIQAHNTRIAKSPEFVTFLCAHSIDFCFVCIDQDVTSDAPRQDVVYAALVEAKVPFVDSGISITLSGARVRGAVTTSTFPAGSCNWQHVIPNATVTGSAPGYRNVQLPEVNALAAALAVMEWRRHTGQYVSDTSSDCHKFRLDTPRIVHAPPRALEQ